MGEQGSYIRANSAADQRTQTGASGRKAKRDAILEHLALRVGQSRMRSA